MKPVVETETEKPTPLPTPETSKTGTSAWPVAVPPVEEPTEKPVVPDTKVADAEVKPGTPKAGDPAKPTASDAPDELGLDDNNATDAAVKAVFKELEEKFPELAKRQRSALSKKVQEAVEAQKKSEKTAGEHAGTLAKIHEDPTVLADFLASKGFKLEKVVTAPDPIEAKLTDAHTKLTAVAGSELADVLISNLRDIVSTISDSKVAPVQAELQQTRVAEKAKQTQIEFESYVKSNPDAVNYVPQMTDFLTKFEPTAGMSFTDALTHAYESVSAGPRLEAFKASREKDITDAVAATLKQMQEAASGSQSSQAPGSTDAKPVSKAKPGSARAIMEEAAKDLGVNLEDMQSIA